MAARFSNPGWRPELYATSMEVARKALAAASSHPAAVFTLNAEPLLHGGDPRWATPTPAQVAALSAAEARAFMEPILTKAPIEVLIAGDTTLDVAIAEVARTFGALPSRGAALAGDTRRVSFPAPTPQPLVFTHTGRPDQAIAAVAWPTNGGVIDPKDALVGDVLAAVMRSRLLEQFRIHDGMTYAPDVTSKASATFDGYGLIKAQAEVAPADIDAFYAAVDKVAADLAATPVSADELARAVTPIAETYVRNRQNNLYWINWMGRLDTNPWAAEHMRTMPAGLTSITPADVQEGARKWLVSAKAWRAKAVAANAG
jgi:zinc protease